jgi:hypothetical protein
MTAPAKEPTPGPAAPAAEARGVAAIVGGAVVFYILMGIVAYITDALLPSLRNPDQTVSNTYLVAWVIGAGAASAIAVEVAKAISKSFNRIALVIFIFVPVLLFVIGLFTLNGTMSFGQLTASLSALIGAVIGLGLTLRDLWDQGKK